MTDSLPVRLNSDRLHDIDTATSFEATGPFSILLQNGDSPVHVHLHLDDSLSRVASIQANNHFVDANDARQVDVAVEDGVRPVEGRIKIVTGHGAETDFVSVRIVEPEAVEERVDVDASLGVPRREDPDPAPAEVLGAALEENAHVAVLGLVAVVGAVGAASLSSSPAVWFGALTVVASVAAAAYLLVG